MGLLNNLSGAEKEEFPPVPKWKPSVVMPIDKVVERFHYYTDGINDFVVFSNSTCVIVADGLSDDAAKAAAIEILSRIFNYHPDMNPANMDDGNVLVRYNHPAYNVVLADVVKANWDEIVRNHLDALARDEVLMTPLGANKFDDFGIKALFGRCFFFMDAKTPNPIRVVRKIK